MVSDRHPDQAIYLDRSHPATRSGRNGAAQLRRGRQPGGEQCHFVAKHEEYLRVGVRDYWILDTEHRRMHALVREGDTWEETIVPNPVLPHRVPPRLQVRPTSCRAASVL